MKSDKTLLAMAKRRVIEDLRTGMRDWFCHSHFVERDNEREVAHARRLLAVAIKAVRAVKR